MKSNARGFTLIELMIVVGIIGLLAAIAIPNFRMMTLRTRKAERTIVMSAIAKAMRENMANRDYQLPGGAITATWDPALPVTPVKKKMDWTQPGWKDLPLSAFGDVYYHYYLYASTSPAPPYFIIQAEGDLDGNGVVNLRSQQWNLQGGIWELNSDTETGDTF